MADMKDFMKSRMEKARRLDKPEEALVLKFSKVSDTMYNYTLDVRDKDMSEDEVISCIKESLVDCVLYEDDFDKVKVFMEDLWNEVLSDKYWEFSEDEVLEEDTIASLKYKLRKAEEEVSILKLLVNKGDDQQ